MTQPIATWLKDLLPRTPGAQRAVVLREFRLAAQEFFTKSYAWRETVGPLVASTMQDPYVSDSYTAVSADPLADVAAVLQVEFNASVLAPMPTRPLGSETPVGTPVSWYSTGLGQFSLWPAPELAVDDDLIVRVALTPKMDAADLPDLAYTRFYDALFDGALGRLYAHPAKPYSNLPGAQYHLQRFRAAIGAAAGDAKQGLINAPNWRFPRFGK